MENKIYDVIIIGGGPAGYTAALYAVRSGLNTLVLEKFAAGGQMIITPQIDNYPGFEEGIDGFTLGQKMQQCAERFGAKTIQAEALQTELKASPKKVSSNRGDFFAKTIIIATGAEHKTLGVEGEKLLLGKGISYCASCDGMLYRGKTVAVVGGGNSAASNALLLSKVCGKVYVIHRRNSLSAHKIYHEPLLKADNIEFKWNSQVKKLLYEESLYGIVLENTKGATEEIKVDGMFVSIGRKPISKLYEGALKVDEAGYIIADESTKTNIPGVFAIGDVRTKALRQIVTAASDGAVAAHFAEEYIESLQ